MSACPQCGTVARPNDKFCNICGTPLARASGAGATPAQAYSAPAQPSPFVAPPPAPQGGYAPAPQGPPVARCQMGHEIAPGTSYCAQGHPIALDQMQFASDAYGAQQGYGAPAPRAGPYGAPPQQPGYGGPPQPPVYAPPQPPAAYAPPQEPPAFGAPAPQGGYFPPAGGYAPPPLQTPYPSPAAPLAPAYAGDMARDAVPPKVLRGFLVAYGTNPGGDFWALTAGRHVVGRASGGDGIDVPLQDPTISSRHATLVVDGASASIAIEDTGSTNGTFVNDEHIGFNGRRELRDGDRLRFGGFTAIVKVIGRV
jgi:hypothetical protein